MDVPLIVGWHFHSNRPNPVAWITAEHSGWKSIIINEIGHSLSPDQRHIITFFGNADKFFALMRMAPSVNQHPEGRKALESLAYIVYAWVCQPRDDEARLRVKFEAEPVIYSGPIIMRIKDGRVTMEGEKVEGLLRNWLVRDDGTGQCLLEIVHGRRIWVTFAVDDMVSHPELVTLLEFNMTPWKPSFVNTAEGLRLIR